MFFQETLEHPLLSPSHGGSCTMTLYQQKEHDTDAYRYF